MGVLTAFRKSKPTWFERGVALRALLDSYGVRTPHGLAEALSSEKKAIASAKKRAKDLYWNVPAATGLMYWFFPEQTVVVLADSFSMTTGNERKEFYSRLVADCAKATGGEWKIDDLDGAELWVSFKSFGRKHKWSFEELGGPWDSGVFMARLDELTKKYLRGAFADAGDDGRTTLTYLTPAGAARKVSAARLYNW